MIVRKAKRDKRRRSDSGISGACTKRQDLLDSLTAKRFDAAYTTATPCKENRYSFRPEEVSAAYNAWPKLSGPCDRSFNGPVERAGAHCISIDRAPLAARMESLP